jgi:ABC-type lipoprotein release transport system permease subunit
MLFQSARPVCAGVTVGMVGAAGSARFIRSLVVGVRPQDPASFTIAVTCLVGVALLAAGIAAIRAARVEPAWALTRDT